MKLNAVILTAALVLWGAVLAQSSGPSAGAAEAGQGGTWTASQAPNGGKKTGAVADKTTGSAKPDAVGVNRSRKADRRLEHYP
jgi:hypothetical protein